MNTRDDSRKHPRSSAAQGGPSLRAGFLGGLLGAASCFGALTLVKVSGPDEALAQDALTDRPRGLISAAEQRIEIIERMDRLDRNLDAIRLLMERQARESNAARDGRR